jgi:hypothetical protein
VSDIDLSGAGALLVALSLVGAGGIAAVIALIAALASSLPPWDSRSQRVARYLAGPMTCVGIGALYAAVGGADLAGFCWPVGIVASVGVQIVVTRNSKGRRNAWLTGPGRGRGK